MTTAQRTAQHARAARYGAIAKELCVTLGVRSVTVAQIEAHLMAAESRVADASLDQAAVHAEPDWATVQSWYEGQAPSPYGGSQPGDLDASDYMPDMG